MMIARRCGVRRVQQLRFLLVGVEPAVARDFAVQGYRGLSCDLERASLQEAFADSPIKHLPQQLQIVIDSDRRQPRRFACIAESFDVLCRLEGAQRLATRAIQGQWSSALSKTPDLRFQFRRIAQIQAKLDQLEGASKHSVRETLLPPESISATKRSPNA
jgi:hypothetical protein